MIQVSILIVNYNTAQWVQLCIESILRHSKEISIEIIVVDNNSVQRDIHTVLAPFPEVILVESASNIGFGAACNLAATIAKGDFLFLLNPDTILQNNAIKYFHDFWQAQSPLLSIACLGTMLQCENGEQQHSFGSFPKMKGLMLSKVKSISRKIFNQKIQSSSLPNFQSYLQVDYITGADLFISKENFLRFHGFDERFFMYFEETDLQKRMKEKGLFAYVITQPIIMHKKGASTEANQDQLRVLYFDSLLLYFKKHHGFFQYFIFSVCWHMLDIKTVFQKIMLTSKMRQL